MVYSLTRGVIFFIVNTVYNTYKDGYIGKILVIFKLKVLLDAYIY